MADRDRPHLIIPPPAEAVPYKPPGGGGGAGAPPSPADRRRHGELLQDQLRRAAAAAAERRRTQPVSVEGALDGVYATFESFPGIALALERLDPRQGKRHPELMSVRQIEDGDGNVVEQATVFIPQGTMSYFVGRIAGYLESVDEDRPRHRDLVDRLETIRAASVEALWTDPMAAFPAHGENTWWEVWLRTRDGQEVQRVRSFAVQAGLAVGRQSLGFGDRTIVLLRSTAEQLATALDVLDDIAELRAPDETATFLATLGAADQADWVNDLARRVEPAGVGAPTVCVLDTGVHAEHPLLAASLAAQDCHAAEVAWSVHDHDGHGTQMAGLALYGDLRNAILGSGPIRLRHRLESVKLLPRPPAENPSELRGATTAAATSRVEIQVPLRRRLYSMSVTNRRPEPGRPAGALMSLGQPSSWSAAIDALAAGRSVDVRDDGLVFLEPADDAARRLFVVSAGNLRRWETEHLARSDVEPIEDPAQAWNVLTVGACTDLDDMTHAPDGFEGWTPLAPRGELSPFSRTSVAFSTKWPPKPDIVLEGGNVARSPDGTTFDTPENLQILTTDAPIHGNRLLTTCHATSPATAQAAALAVGVMAEYPSLWPETVRALVVHSAQWTAAMRTRFPTNGRKGPRVALRRRYGMGVPDLLRATRSAADALTLITEGTICPFQNGTMREIHFHDVPWPGDVLQQLGAAPVRLRVTLSYFVEPNPGSRGWRRRYSYASHGLRFDVRRATESQREFEERINEKARREDEGRPAGSSDTGEWFFGPDHQRAPGSLHADIWTGSAADLAQRGALAVFPVTGWWKENPARDRSDHGARYALVVSVETPDQDVDVWTPVAQQIGLTIPTTVTS